MEATGDGVMGLDLDMRCTSLNRTGSELLGVTEVHARGLPVHELLHGGAPDERAHDADDCPAAAAFEVGRMVENSDDVVWRRDGSSFPARWQVRPRIDGREVQGAVVTISDMTEIREVESALRQAVGARDEVVAVVSHDLRNPLGTIAAAADLLIELDLSEAQKREQLDIIRRSSGRMGRLIGDLLDVARIEVGALAVDPRPMDVALVLAETVELFRPQAGQLEIELDADTDHDLPRVLAERGRIEQVLANLVGNALRFTSAGGWIRLRVRPQDGFVRVEVQDSGSGISDEAIEHLFDRFWQPGGRGGTGLGLTIVQGIVEAHGGKAWVSSELGKGSTFYFTLPSA